MIMDVQSDAVQRAGRAAFAGVDGILVINLDSSPLRYERFMAEVGKFLPEEKLVRISAVPGRSLLSYGQEPWFTENTGERAVFWGGTAGCVLSHRNAIAYARNKGWRNVLIFEDDVSFEPSEDGFAAVGAALATLRGPYMFYLGYNRPAPFGVECFVRGGASVWRTDGVITAHSYIVSAELYDPLLKAFPQADDDVWEWLARYRAVDVLYRDYVPKWRGVGIYVLNPIICLQVDGESDIGRNEAEGPTLACRQAPRSKYSLAGMWYMLTAPYRRMKIFLNSLRTLRRARRKGLPGAKRTSH